MSVPRLSSCLRILAAIALTAQLSAAATTVPPRPTKQVSAVHPADLLAQGVDGEAKIIFTVDENGKVVNPTVRSATDPAFGEAALAAIQQWEFTPATVDGVPAAKRVAQVFTFEAPIDRKLVAAAGREVFIQPDPEPLVDATALSVPLKVVEPPQAEYPFALAGSGRKGEANISFIVGTDGMAWNPTVEGKADEFTLPAIVAVLRAKWEPPTQDGAPVNVRTSLTVVVAE